MAEIDANMQSPEPTGISKTSHMIRTYNMDDCTEFYNIQEKDGVPLWKCSICHLSCFKHKCLLDNHILNVHLNNMRCTWCHSKFDSIQELKSHCLKLECQAGVYKHLNKSDSVKHEKINTEIETHSEISDQDNENVQIPPSNNLAEQNVAQIDIVSPVVSDASVVQKDSNDNTPLVTRKASLKPKVSLKKVKEHRCKICRQRFFDQHDLNHHMKYKLFCKMHKHTSKDDQEDITKHYRIVIDENKNVKSYLFQCTMCNKCHPNQFSVKRHIRRHHWRMKPYHCHICKKRFFDSSSLKFHTSSSLGCRNVDIAFAHAVEEDGLDWDETIADKINNLEEIVKKSAHGTAETIFTTNTNDSSENKIMTSAECRMQRKGCSYGIENNCIINISFVNEPSASDSKEKMVKSCEENERIVNKLNNVISEDPDTEQKMFRCRICSQVIIGAEEYKQHLKDDLENDLKHRPLHCMICNKKFTHRHSYAYHVNFVHTKHRFSCHLCSLVFPTKRKVRLHMLKDHSNISNKLQRMNFEFISSEESFTELCCGLCSFKTKKPKLMEIHKRKHDQLNLKCDRCKVTFKDVFLLNLHVKQCRRKAVCSYCKQTFPSRKDRERHVRMAHEAEILIECNVCHKQYKGAYRLRFHKSMYHSKRKNKFSCEHCSYKSWNKYAMKQHSYQHSEMREIKFKCQVCGKVFNSFNALGRHKLLHTDTRNHECNVCFRKFTQKCTLTRHMDTHTKIKRYKCAICEMLFTQSYPLSKHVKLTHPIMFDQFQKERLTEKWRNSEPETYDPQRIVNARQKAQRKQAMTIVQIPLQAEDKENKDKVQYKWIVMDSEGGVTKPKEQDLVGSVMTALDIQDGEVDPAETNTSNVHSVSNDMNATKAPTLIVIQQPAQQPCHIPNTQFIQQETTTLFPKSESDVQNSVAEDSQLIETVVKENDLYVDVANYLIGGDTPSTSGIQSNLPFEPSSALPIDALDFSQMLGFQDAINEAALEGGLSFQGVSDDNFFDFLNNPSSQAGLLSAGASTSFTSETFIQEQDQVGVKLIDAPTTNIVLPSQNIPSTSEEEMSVEQNVNELAVDQSNGDVELPTIQNIPNWTGEQLVLIQDENESYIISANNLAQLASGLSVDNQDPQGTVYMSDDTSFSADQLALLDVPSSLDSLVNEQVLNDGQQESLNLPVTHKGKEFLLMSEGGVELDVSDVK